MLRVQAPHQLLQALGPLQVRVHPCGQLAPRLRVLLLFQHLKEELWCVSTQAWSSPSLPECQCDFYGQRCGRLWGVLNDSPRLPPDTSRERPPSCRLHRH